MNEITPEERLLKILVDRGIVLKDASPTFSELLLTVETLIKSQAQLALCSVRREDISKALLTSWQSHAKKMWNLDNSQTLPPWVRQAIKETK